MHRVARRSPSRLGLAFAAVLASLALFCSLAASADAHKRHHHHPHHGNLVPPNPTLTLDWYDLTKQTVTAAAISEQVTQSRVWAVSWLAAARAVDDGHGREFQTAAFATALRDTLVALVPGQQPQLDAALASTLATVPNGKAKQKGIYAGHQEAQTILLQRSGDGLDVASVSPPWTPPAPAPGIYQPTPPTFGPVVRAGQGNASAFLLASNSQFRPGPPPALNSPTYLKALAEVHAVGQDTSAVRTPAQLDTALFWAQSSHDAYVQILRGVLANTSRPLDWDAKAVAAFYVVTIDAQIAVYDAKYVYTFWRPVTAIRVGSVDPDPAWTPLIATPRHPEYPSGHTGYAGAAEVVLTALTGPWTPGPISATSSTAPGSVHTYNRWSTITQENIDGRVWEGVHFRFSDEIAAKLGKKVAAYDLQRLHKLGL
jgi:hypothetical protein